MRQIRRQRTEQRRPKQNVIEQNSTVQYSTVQYSTVQYSTVQYSTVQYSTVQYSTAQLLELTRTQSPTEMASSMNWNIGSEKAVYGEIIKPAMFEMTEQS
jgi:hypothetical protein